MASKALSRVIASPGRIASLLDRSSSHNTQGRPILALEIQRYRIGMAVVWSPRSNSTTSSSTTVYSEDDDEASRSASLSSSSSCRSIRGMSLGDVELLEDLQWSSSSSSCRRRIPSDQLNQLAAMVQEYQVCGFVVGWPMQSDTGKLGAPCGRVLYTLESLLQCQQEQQYSSSSSSSIILSKHDQHNGPQHQLLSPQRPLCFWSSSNRRTSNNSSSSSMVSSSDAGDDDLNNTQRNTRFQVDAWGRCPAYARASSDHDLAILPYTRYLASTEQYAFDPTYQATDVWKDFWKTHWPREYEKSLEQQQQQKQQQQQRLLWQQQEQEPSSNMLLSSKHKWNHRRYCGNLVSDCRDARASYLNAVSVGAAVW